MEAIAKNPRVWIANGPLFLEVVMVLLEICILYGLMFTWVLEEVVLNW